MPKLLRRIILELDGHKEANGHSEAILRLLDWDDESREKLVWGIGELRRKTRKDGGIHDFTIASSERGTGVTCFVTTSSKVHEAQRKLQTYCVMKKYQVRANSWVGLLTVVDQQPIIQGFLVLGDPWVYNSEVEKLVAGLPSSMG